MRRYLILGMFRRNDFVDGGGAGYAHGKRSLVFRLPMREILDVRISRPSAADWRRRMSRSWIRNGFRRRLTAVARGKGVELRWCTGRPMRF